MKMREESNSHGLMVIYTQIAGRMGDRALTESGQNQQTACYQLSEFTKPEADMPSQSVRHYQTRTQNLGSGSGIHHMERVWKIWRECWRYGEGVKGIRRV